ncbi:hypothetical protein ACEXQE_02650 [Herbiconiux sp. P17]|uniref:hypothetical protein n=1 Tax=Herbiconiux wuyangfengii TaxID=3342794 RepID=UPI0035B7CCF3
MTNHRVLVDIEFTVDEDRFKIDQLADDATGVSDVTDTGLRDAVSRLLIRADWTEHGLAPLRSLVTTSPLTPGP